MHVWNVLLHAARCKYRKQKLAKNRHLGTIAQLYLHNKLRHVSTVGKTLAKQQHQLHISMVNFGSLAAVIGPVAWDTPANFNGFRVLPALLHSTPRDASIRRQPNFVVLNRGRYLYSAGLHHVGHWPTF